jgi:membrane protease YdiL (CAAX protease family)
LFTNLNDRAKAFTYYAIAFALVVLVAVLSPVFTEASPLISMLTAATAVVIMLLVVTRDGRSAAAWKGLGLIRAGFSAWPFAILGPLAILVASYVFLWLSPLADYKPPEPGVTLAQAIPNIGIGLAMSVVLALAEEVGWRGYMLPRLLAIGAVPAMLIVGFLHGVWHLPLMLGTPYYHTGANPMLAVPMFLATLTLAGVFYGYLYLSTRSVWPVAIAHGVVNIAWNVLGDLTVETTPGALEYVGGESGILMIAGLAIIAVILIVRMRGGAWMARQAAVAS